MKKKFYKHSLIPIIFVFGFVFFSCQKESLETEKKADFQKTDQIIINDFNLTLNTELSENRTNQIKSINVNYYLNPYDHYGELHNQLLTYLFDNGYIKADMSLLMAELSKQGNIKFTKEPSFYNEMIQSLDQMVYNNDKSYNPTFINTTGEHVPYLEKATVNSYFLIMTEIDNKNLRILLSKAAEYFVINSNYYSDISKKRILTTFALYRYSTYFWNDKVNDNGVSMRQCDIVDAIGAYIATHGEFEPGVIEDGADVNNFACTFSAIYSNFLWMLCY